MLDFANDVEDNSRLSCQIPFTAALDGLKVAIAPEDAAAEAEWAVRDILAALRARTRHDFSYYRRATLMRRIERRLKSAP